MGSIRIQIEYMSRIDFWTTDREFYIFFLRVQSLDHKQFRKIIISKLIEASFEGIIMILSQIVYLVNIYLKPNDEWVEYVNEVKIIFYLRTFSQAIEDSEIIKSYGGVFWKDFFNAKWRKYMNLFEMKFLLYPYRQKSISTAYNAIPLW